MIIYSLRFFVFNEIIKINKEEMIMHIQSNLLKKTLIQREEINKVLKDLYESADIAGYRYVKDIIFIQVNIEGKKKQKIKVYYERIGEVYKVTAGSVELAIRYYINNVFTRGNNKEIEKRFGSEVWKNGGVVGNKKFVSVISQHVEVEVEKRMLEHEEDKELLEREIYLKEEINSELCKCRECNNEKCRRRRLIRL